MRYMKNRGAVFYLLIANAAFFLLQLAIPGFTSAFSLISADLSSRPWILLTHMFLHGGFAHILFNMYALAIFGGLLEQKIGTKRFLGLYFASGLVAGFVSSYFYGNMVGASGAIMGVLAALILLMPDLKVLFFFAIPMKFWVAGVVWILLDITGVFFPSGIGHIAHLAGTAIGFLYGLYLIKTRKKFRKKFVVKTHLDDKDIEDYYKRGRL